MLLKEEVILLNFYTYPIFKIILKKTKWLFTTNPKYCII
jgi:hypothetical protein